MPDRLAGFLRPPTREQVADHAARFHLHPSPDELDALHAAVTGSVRWLDGVEELDQPVVELRHRHRDPGRPPRADEDPCNAFIRFCEVRGAPDGPLAGRTVAVKDCIAVAGVPMTNGGRRTPVAVPTEDAVVVERLLDAGAVIIGKTNLEDLAHGMGERSAFGPVRNPANPRFATGGSSSGSAAAVAAGMVDVAIGADQGGSTRGPAAWCGVVGMKATHGLVPSYGLHYLDHTIDHVGPITSTVEDNARVLEVIAGSDWRDAQWVRCAPRPGEYVAAASRGVSGLRIGVLRESLAPAGCTDEVLASFDAAVSTLAGLGATIVDVSVPMWPVAVSLIFPVASFGTYGMAVSNGIGFGHLGRVDPVLTSIWGAQATLQADDEPATQHSQLVTTSYVLEQYQGLPFVKAHNLRLELRRRMSAMFDDADVVLTPMMPRTAYELIGPDAPPERAQEQFASAFAAVANAPQADLSGHPALTVPCGTGEHGLPIGLQIMAPHFAEERCYQVALAVERART